MTQGGNFGAVNASESERKKLYGDVLSPKRLVIFNLLAIPLGGAGLPLMLLAPHLYATHFGIPLTTIGLIFLFSKIGNTLADPIVGTLSDRTNNYLGRRRPWILGGCILLGLGAKMLYLPPPTIDAPYLVVALFVFYTGYSMVEVAFSAWAGEMAPRGHERTRVAAYQAMMRALGLFAIVALPASLALGKGVQPLLTMNIVGFFILTTIILAMLVLSRFSEVLPARSEASAVSSWQMMTLAAHDRGLVTILVADVAVTAAQSARAGLLTFFCIEYMGDPTLALRLYLLQLAIGLLASPLWLSVSRRVGRRSTAIIVEAVQGVINLALLAVVPGSASLLIALTVAQGLTQGAGNLMLRAMVADAAESTADGVDESCTGLYFSVFTIASKLGLALGIGLALPLAAWLGFVPGASEAVRHAKPLLYIFSLMPAMCHLFAALLIARSAIDVADA